MPTTPSQPGFGLPTQGVVPTDYLAAAYPYYSFIPNLALQLANMQFGAGMDAQTQNNALAMQLAQGAASNRLADNMGSRLALRGLGPVPGFGSAFGQGNWGVSPVQAPNIGSIFGNLFGQTSGYLNPQSSFYAGNTGQFRPGMGQGQFADEALKAMNSGNQALGQYLLGVSAGTQQWDPAKVQGFGGNINDYVNPMPGYPTGGLQSRIPGGGFGGQPPANIGSTIYTTGAGTYNAQSPVGQSTVGQPMPTPGGAFGGTNPFGSMGSTIYGYQPPAGGFGGTSQQTQSPFADVQKLAFGQGGFGPTQFNDPALGLSMGAPRTTLGQYYGGDPYARQAQDYMASLFGYDPQMLQYERSFFTPGARTTPRMGFGY